MVQIYLKQNQWVIVLQVYNLKILFVTLLFQILLGPDNVIAYNGTINSVDNPTGGILNFSGKNSILVTKNSIFGNIGKGINYPENDATVEPPTIIYHDLENGVVSGMACLGCEVEIFSTLQNEGDKFEGSVKTDDFGNFVFSKGEPFSGPNLTTIAISSANKTSEISDPTSYNSAMRAALAMMEGEPTYQTSFDIWEFGEPGENVVMENGRLILSTDGRNIGQGVSEQSADKIAVQFEFQIPESDPDGTCFLGMGNDELRRSFGIGFRSDGISFAEQYFHPDQYPRVAEGTYEYYSNQPNEGLVIVVEDQINVLLNDQLVFSFFDPQGSVVYNFQSVSAEWGVTCEYDNYKIWNLEGLEFEPLLPPLSLLHGFTYQTIQRYINDNSPTFEDDFSTAKEEWGKISVNQGTRGGNGF